MQPDDRWREVEVFLAGVAAAKRAAYIRESESEALGNLYYSIDYEAGVIEEELKKIEMQTKEKVD